MHVESTTSKVPLVISVICFSDPAPTITVEVSLSPIQKSFTTFTSAAAESQSTSTANDASLEPCFET